MLIITLINDKTSDFPLIVGNYDYTIKVGNKIIHEGKIKDHNRLTGYQGLIRLLAEDVGDKTWLEIKEKE